MPFDASPTEVPVETRPDGPVTRVLIEARTKITKENWFQGTTGRTLPGWAGPVGCVCAWMAIGPEHACAVFARANGIAPIGNFPSVGIIHWNNADERVWEDIHPAFDKAIALARSEGA